ncbi:MAG: DEAD/DEAH box helicase [Saprospiraceae bacterium]
MFLNSAIYDYLDKSVNLKMNKEGLNLLRDGAVTKVSFDQQNKVFSIEARDGHLYKIVVIYHNAFRLQSVECTCGVMACQHSAAALHYLVSKSDVEINAVRDFTEETILQAKQESKDKAQEIESFIFQNASPNSFRKIPEKAFENWNTFMDYAAQDFRSAMTYPRTVEAYFLPENVIEATIVEPNWSRKTDSHAVVVSIKPHGKHSEIKCSECLSSTRKLCNHQTYLLKNYFRSSFLTELFNSKYSAIAGDLAGKNNIALAKFSKIYEVEVGKSEFIEKKKNLNYLGDAEINSLSIYLRKIYDSRDEQEKERMTIKGQKEIENFKNALVWLKDEAVIAPMLVEGKAAKYGKKLISTIEQIDVPQFLSRDQEHFYKDIKAIFEKYPLEKMVQIRSLLEKINSEPEIFQQLMHFYLPAAMELKKSWLKPITFRQETASVKFKVEVDDLFINISKILMTGNTVADPKSENLGFFVLDHESGYLFADEFQHLFWKNTQLDHLVIDKEERLMALQIISSLMNHHEVDLPADFELKTEMCHNGARELYITEAGHSMIFQPFLRYADTLKFNVLSGNHQVSGVKSNSTIFEMDEDERNTFIDLLCAAHPLLKESYQETGLFAMNIADCLKNAWFLKFFEQCRFQDIAIFGQDNLKNFKFNTNTANINTSIKSGIDWFDVSVDIQFGDLIVKHKDWIESVRNNEKYIQLDDGTFGIIPEEWYEKLQKLAKVVDVQGEELIINKFKFGIVDQLFEELSDDHLYQEMKYRVSRLNDIQEVSEFELPAIVNAEMRAYQVEGYHWLRTLDEISFGGCLADDMGLGKTLQVITLLAHQKNMERGSSLIVVPRSLLFNWAAEIDKFCPSLSYILYHGPFRLESQKRLMDFDLVITTYDTASIDIEFFKEKAFNYIILDESQAIKNPNSKRYKAMRLLNSRNKLVMTGTPLENNTFDLYAQFSFINPGMFGNQKSFKDRFSTPIDKEGDGIAADMLRKIIKPFFLRRTKELVAKDLPAKTENIIFCEMDATQREMYEALKAQIKEEIDGTIKINGIEKSRFKILEGLLRLRQMCNAPALLDNTLPKHRQTSVKIETLIDIVENDLGTHNALVFSQFTSMLDLIRKELDKRQIKYAYLDGSTRDRKGAVDHFQESSDVNLFLISLKAGNTGLNLVKADYVYIVDPWWNPAVEAQAIDRTHRIGQDKHIFAYRMICKNTIEEKIMQLQQKKQKIAQDIIVNDESVFRSLDKEELMDLFI